MTEVTYGVSPIVFMNNSVIWPITSCMNCSLNTFFHTNSCYFSLAFSSHTVLLFVPGTGKACSCLKSFVSIAPSVWNALPHKAGNSPFSSQFMNHSLKTFLIIIPFYCFSADFNHYIIFNYFMNQFIYLFLPLPLGCKHQENWIFMWAIIF